MAHSQFARHVPQGADCCRSIDFSKNGAELLAF
jgi:hypothetical protein